MPPGQTSFRADIDDEPGIVREAGAFHLAWPSSSRLTSSLN